MAFLFGRGNRQKPPMELAKGAKELLQKLSTIEKLPQPQEEALAQKISQMKLMLQGTQGVAQSPQELDHLVNNKMKTDPLHLQTDLSQTLPTRRQLIMAGEPPFLSETEVSPQQVHELIQCLITEDLLFPLAQNMWKLPFEARKDTQFIFSAAFRYKAPGPNGAPSQDPIALHHVLSMRPQIIIELCNGYKYQQSAMPCGGILREILKYDAVAALILYDEPDSPGGAVNLQEVDTARPTSGKGVFWTFFDWITRSNFDVCTDAFNTFREILTKNKELVAVYLDTNFTTFFPRYNTQLILSENYVTKRQSIKLLGELLLDRANYTVMTRYVDSPDHLKITMTLLRDERKMINYESFHVFKVFVANPNKSAGVKRMLQLNRERLLRFLPGFLDDRTDDDQFNDEKSFLIRQIELLPSLQGGASSASSTANPSGVAAAASTGGDAGSGGGVAPRITSPNPGSGSHQAPTRNFSGTV